MHKFRLMLRPGGLASISDEHIRQCTQLKLGKIVFLFRKAFFESYHKIRPTFYFELFYVSVSLSSIFS